VRLEKEDGMGCNLSEGAFQFPFDGFRFGSSTNQMIKPFKNRLMSLLINVRGKKSIKLFVFDNEPCRNLVVM